MALMMALTLVTLLDQQLVLSLAAQLVMTMALMMALPLVTLLDPPLVLSLAAHLVMTMALTLVTLMDQLLVLSLAQKMVLPMALSLVTLLVPSSSFRVLAEPIEARRSRGMWWLDWVVGLGVPSLLAMRFSC